MAGNSSVAGENKGGEKRPAFFARKEGAVTKNLVDDAVRFRHLGSGLLQRQNLRRPRPLP